MRKQNKLQITKNIRLKKKNIKYTNNKRNCKVIQQINTNIIEIYTI